MDGSPTLPEVNGEGTLWQDEMGVKHLRFTAVGVGISIEVEIVPDGNVELQLAALWNMSNQLPGMISQACDILGDDGWPG